MKKYFINSIKQAFYPHIVLLILENIFSAGFLILIFLNQLEHEIFAYCIYVLAAYTLVCDIIQIWNKIRTIKKSLYRISLIHRYKTDLAFKTESTLYLSVSINLIYSCFKAFAGLYYHSLWFGTVALYYIVLTIARFQLLSHIQRKKRNYKSEIQKYCLCGYLLLFLTVVIAGMNVYMINEEKTSIYPLYFIYVVAGYTFYIFITAIINIVRYRKEDNLLYHASKMITLATAFVSVFSLQTAMFAEFSNNYVQQRTMNILTGTITFVIVMSIAMYMIIHGKILYNTNQ